MKLSVIIPCYNCAGVIGPQLEALANQEWTEPWEVVVANNGSEDHLLSVLESYRERLPYLRWVDASARKGQPYALNVGAEAALGECLAFCDADDVAGVGWVAAIGEALARHDLVASRFEFKKLNSPGIEKVRHNRQSEGLQPYLNPQYMPHAGGCGLGVKRSLFQSIGGFDETLPILHDTDLCWRLQLKGIQLHFVPEAIVHIRFRDTIPGIYLQARNFGEYNVLLYKRYRGHGMPSAAWWKAARSWLRLMLLCLRLRNESTRLRWVRQFGWRVGRLRGCIKYRVLAP